MSGLDPVAGAAPSRGDLFGAFFKIGILGFGGVAAFARHVLVVERGFLSEREFAEAFGIASTLPGANTVNMAAMLGDRWRGPTGALAALAGLLGAPLAILVALLGLYARFSGEPDVQAAFAGAAAAAAGLVAGTSLKLLRGLRPDLGRTLVFVGVCLASALLRAPMLLILALAIPASLLLVLGRRRRA